MAKSKEITLIDIADKALKVIAEFEAVDLPGTHESTLHIVQGAGRRAQNLGIYKLRTHLAANDISLRGRFISSGSPAASAQELLIALTPGPINSGVKEELEVVLFTPLVAERQIHISKTFYSAGGESVPFLVNRQGIRRTGTLNPQMGEHFTRHFDTMRRAVVPQTIVIPRQK